MYDKLPSSRLFDQLLDPADCLSTSILSRYAQYRVELLFEPLKVRHVARSCQHGVRAEGVETLDVFETGERAVGRCSTSVAIIAWTGIQAAVHCYMHRLQSARCRIAKVRDVPRLSAANMIPPSNRRPITEVPVTNGCLSVSFSPTYDHRSGEASSLCVRDGNSRDGSGRHLWVEHVKGGVSREGSAPSCGVLSMSAMQYERGCKGGSALRPHAQ